MTTTQIAALVYERSTNMQGVEAMAISPDRTRLAVSSRSRISIHSPAGDVLDDFLTNCNAKWISFSEGGSWLLAVASDSVEVHSLDPRVRDGRIGLGDSHRLELSRADFQVFCTAALCDQNMILAIAFGRETKVYRLRENKAALFLHSIDSSEAVQSLGFSADGMNLFVKAGETLTFYKIDQE